MRPAAVPQRVVFDTNTVISALLFTRGSLAWMRGHWRAGHSVPLISRETAAEITRVLRYPKFRLPPEDQLELLADYIPFCESIEAVRHCSALCRDPKDQPLLDLAASGNATLLVTGDEDLLVLANAVSFVIETPAAFRMRFSVEP